MSLSLGNINRASAIPSVYAQEARFMAHLGAGNFYSSCGTRIEITGDEANREVVADTIARAKNISPLYVADPLFSSIYGSIASQGLLIPSFQGKAFFHPFLLEHFPDAVNYAQEELPQTFIGNTTSSFSPISVGNNCRLIDCVDCYIQDDDGLSDNPDYRSDRTNIKGSSINIKLVNCSNVFILRSSNIKLNNCSNLIIVDSDGLDLNGEDEKLIYEGKDYPGETDFTNREDGPYGDPYNLCAFEHTTWTDLAMAGKNLGRSSVDFTGALISTNPDLARRALSIFEYEVRAQIRGGVSLQEAFQGALAQLTSDGVLDLSTPPLLEGPKEQ